MTIESNPEQPSNNAQKQPPSQKSVAEQSVSKELAREFRWVEFAQIGSNLILAVVGILAVCIYAGQLGQMRKSTEVARVAADAAKQSADSAANSFKMEKRHTEDTDQAIIQMRGEVENGNNIATLQLFNTGKVGAHNVTAHFEIWRRELPSNKRISRLGVFDVTQDELHISPSQITKRIILPEMGQADWERMAKTKEGISFSAVIQYENGFDDIRHPSDCQEMVMVPPHPNDAPQTIRGNLVDCDNVPAWLEQERLTRKRLMEQKVN